MDPDPINSVIVGLHLHQSNSPTKSRLDFSYQRKSQFQFQYIPIPDKSQGSSSTHLFLPFQRFHPILFSFHSHSHSNTSNKMMKLKQLESYLGSLQQFSNPKVLLHIFSVSNINNSILEVGICFADSIFLAKQMEYSQMACQSVVDSNNCSLFFSIIMCTDICSRINCFYLFPNKH